MRATSSSFDAVIIGSGYSGSLAGLLLARKGHSVALIDRNPHPRFSVGESTTGDQNRCHAVFAHQYGIPELQNLTSYVRIKQHRVPVSIWPKEMFYFFMDPHQGAEPSAPREVMLQSPPWPVGPDYHCMRDEYDLHFLTLARKYGARHFGMANLKDLDLAGGVRCLLETSRGETEIKARFCLDASGPGAVLARKLGQKLAAPASMTLRSRAIFSHFIGVKRLEQSVGRDWPSIGLPRDHGTVHYLWSGGWVWFIPFDNGITSVGIVLNMDRDTLDHDKLNPEQAFWRIVAEEPVLAEMLAEADSIRPFVRTERMQWMAEQTIGPNWLMLPPSSGFTDPLLSPGNAMVANAVGRLASGIDAVLREGQPTEEALGYVQDRFRIEAEYVARLQHVLFESFQNHELFREVFTLFPLAAKMSVVCVPESAEAVAFPPIWGLGHRALRELIDRVHHELRAGLAAGVAAPDLAARLRETIRNGDPTRYAEHFYRRPNETPNLHYNQLAPLLRWAAGLRRCRDEGIRAGARGGIGRIHAQAHHTWRSGASVYHAPLGQLKRRHVGIQLRGLAQTAMRSCRDLAATLLRLPGRFTAALRLNRLSKRQPGSLLP
jgi:FADH2 O2-dependent halogenase